MTDLNNIDNRPAIPLAEVEAEGPQAGPQNIRKEIRPLKQSGVTDNVAFSPDLFTDLQRTYSSFGFTYSPDAAAGKMNEGPVVVGNLFNAVKNNGNTLNDVKKAATLTARAQKRLAKRQTRINNRKEKNNSKANKKDDKNDNNELKDDDKNKYGFELSKSDPWGTSYHEDSELDTQSVGDEQDTQSDNENTNNESKYYSKDRFTSIFHGKSERDYLGRTYMHIPANANSGSDLRKDVIELLDDDAIQTCYLPKVSLHTFDAHNKGVSAIKLFPKSGHIFLSVGLDGKAKLWDLYNDRACLRTFQGHTKGCRGVSFNHDGTQFITASYDRSIALWDVESGQCISSFSCKRIPLCSEFFPNNGDSENLFLAGMNDNKILQFDTRTGEIEQEYDQHLGPVNSITFVDNGRRFASTSDDKTMRFWDFGIPVVIKYIADPTMHSMPAVTLSPNNRWLACQSLDNRIMVYSARDKFQLNKKKEFKGHLVSGYACKPSFSPDGRYLTSGDSEGKVFFWDWKTGKNLKRFNKAHNSVIIDTVWLPHETSKLLTASWDGTIKLWD